jgi:hypothetical protein
MVRIYVYNHGKLVATYLWPHVPKKGDEVEYFLENGGKSHGEVLSVGYVPERKNGPLSHVNLMVS